MKLVVGTLYAFFAALIAGLFSDGNKRHEAWAALVVIVAGLIQIITVGFYLFEKWT